VSPKGEACFAPTETYIGRAEGRSPFAFLLSPKIEDPPQEEWGAKGVE